mmetsp:Transcript_21340/g.34305  ORF Transcript_21340/g.34305 Transcript_21340/m.34305 type:complete len:195 (+) Transcript_21340:61-645(+)
MTTDVTYRRLRTTNKPRAGRLPSGDDTSSEEIKNIPLIDQVPLRRTQSFPNLAVNFADSKAFWLYYLLIIFLSWFSVFVFSPLFNLWPAMTMVNIGHAAVTFYLMHWRRGTPLETFDQGKNDRYTFWEMLDEGAQYTPTRKFFQIVPMVLFLLACYDCEWRKRYYFSNSAALFLSVFPKFEFMMGVRIFGINKD